MEKNLLERLRNWDDDAFNYIYRNCYPKILKLAAEEKNLDKAYNPRDYFQDALVVLIEEKLPEPNFVLKGSICTYLYGIIFNLVRDKSRRQTTKSKQQYEKQLIKDLIDIDGQEDIIAYIEENITILKVAIGKLNKRCQDILDDFYVKGMPFEEIDEKYAYAKNAGKGQKFRCLNYLKKHFFELKKVQH